MHPNDDKQPDNDKWTVMVYLAGDNSLTDQSVFSLKEMRRAGHDPNINVVAQFDPAGYYLKTHRYKINHKPNEQGGLSCDIVATFPFNDSFAGSRPVPPVPDHPAHEPDSGDPNLLINFILFCMHNYPAEKFMLILSGHGSGTEQDFLMKDESPQGYLTMKELKGAFRHVYNVKGRKIDMLGMDACLMSMAEISYELRDYIGIIVGSEGYTPMTGWPYHQIITRLKELVGKGEATPEKFAEHIVKDYVNYYAAHMLGGLSVDMAALNLARSGDLKALVSVLARGLIEELKNPQTKEKVKDALILAHWKAQSYNGELFVDLYDFCDCLKERYSENGIGEACYSIKRYIEKDFVMQSCYSGPEYQFSKGVSIYFPWSRVALHYNNLDFAKDSDWAKFLIEYTKETRREPLGARAEDPIAERNKNAAFRFRMSSGRGSENPIHSMRNPPIVAPVEEHIEEEQCLDSGLNTFPM